MLRLGKLLDRRRFQRNAVVICAGFAAFAAFAALAFSGLAALNGCSEMAALGAI